MQLASCRRDGAACYGIAQHDRFTLPPADFQARFPDLQSVLQGQALDALAAACAAGCAAPAAGAAGAVGAVGTGARTCAADGAVVDAVLSAECERSWCRSSASRTATPAPIEWPGRTNR